MFYSDLRREMRKLKEDSKIVYGLKSQRMIRKYSNKHFSPFAWNIGVQPECINFLKISIFLSIYLF